MYFSVAMFVNRLLFCLLCAFVAASPHDGFGQQSATDTVAQRFLLFSPGYAMQHGRDEGMSPLTYRGSHFHGTIGVEKRKKDNLNALHFSAAIGKMQAYNAPITTRPSALALRLQMDYSYQRRIGIWLDDQLAVYVGASWNNLLHVLWHRQYVNNSLNYIFSSAIGPSGQVDYQFKIKSKQFRIHAQLQIPLLAFNMRPAYASSLPEGYIAQDRSNVRAFFDSGKLVTLNRFFRLRNTLGVAHPLRNGNELFLNYCWDYYSSSTMHRTQLAVHQISLGWRFRF